MADALNRNLFTACIFQPGPHGTGHSADGVLQLILTYQVISFPGIVLQVVELIDTPDTLVKNIFIPVAAHSENSRGLRVSIFPIDRKSTRLNLQSLMRISYAVFCLKK